MLYRLYRSAFSDDGPGNRGRRAAESAPARLARAARSGSLGLELALSVLVGFFIGWLLDSVLHTRPWLMLVFLLLGGVAGFRSLWRAVRATRQ
jgi:F0F1-type ATP synthase assembly protein I